LQLRVQHHASRLRARAQRRSGQEKYGDRDRCRRESDVKDAQV
jgi:hypothetical protein